ncbi:transcriptional regulator [Acuticoccus sediminis]|uniref:Transcriptional regulator n=1 Tax=Acuticoccus sediminis TaxID=2184697 RepID=A0A8B2NRY6_9HYPH|nr:transcriptional regulator [Acuticoccus sediminis]
MITSRQVKAARALLGWSQSDLSAWSGVSAPTIARLEAIDGPLGGRAYTVRRICQALEAGGIQFILASRRGVGVRLKTARKATDKSMTSPPTSSSPAGLIDAEPPADSESESTRSAERQD